MGDKMKKSSSEQIFKRLSVIITRVTGSKKLEQLPDNGTESITRLLGYLTSYTGNLPGELDAGRDTRLSVWGSFPKSTMLDNYCRTAFETPCEGKMANERIGDLIKRLIDWKILDTDGIFTLKDNETPPSVDANGSQQKKSVNEERINDTMNTQDVNNVEMNENDVTKNPYDKLREEAKKYTGDSSSAPIMPNDTEAKPNPTLGGAMGKSTTKKNDDKPVTSAAGQKAIREIVKATVNNRVDFSQNAKVKVVGYTQIGVSDRIEGSSIKDGVIVGTVSGAANALSKFEKLLGYHAVERQEVDEADTTKTKVVKEKAYDNLVSQSEKWMAEKIHSLLVRAADAERGRTITDPNTGKSSPCVSPLIPVYTGNYTDDNPMPKSIKGIVYVFHDETKVLPWSDVKKMLINDSMSFINVEGLNDCQLRLQEPKTKSGDRKLKHSVKISQRKELNDRSEIMIPVKNVNKENHSVKGGLRSEYSIKYLTDKLDVNGNRKTMTYRIPLKAEQYEVVVVDQYKDMFKTVTSEVSPIKLPDSNDQVAIKYLQDLITGAMNEDSSLLNAKNAEEFKRIEKEVKKQDASEGASDAIGVDGDTDFYE